MKYKEKTRGNIVIIAIVGNMMGGTDSNSLKKFVEQKITQGKKNFIFDLGKVLRMNSSGLGTLMSIYGIITKNGGKIILSSVSNKIESLLIVTKLFQFFESYENLDRACASMIVG